MPSSIFKGQKTLALTGHYPARQWRLLAVHRKRQELFKNFLLLDAVTYTKRIPNPSWRGSVSVLPSTNTGSHKI